VPLWRLKIVKRSGPGGHRGILDIMASLNTEEFLRVKLGIGRPHPGVPTEGYVLSHFPAAEAEQVAQFIERGAQAVETLLAEGLAAAQTRFHGEPADLPA
jgi:peptidyl-tRNA hydrolase, PTH1 family